MMAHTRFWLYGALGLCLILPPTLARSQEAEDSDEAALLDLLAEETELATRTRQNADYVPGIVSVLHGEELAALGARTVLDGLALVPGIEVLRDAGGSATLRVRGIDFFFNSGNVKVLIDGLDMGAETAALNSAVLLMPIAQIERIEVIRGPGSSLHGDFAFTGLVNLITRQSGARASAEVGDGALRRGLVSGGGEGQGWRWGGNLSTTVSDRYDAAGTAPADERHRFGNALVEGHGWSLKAAALDREQRRPLPAPNGPPAVNQRRYEQIRNYELRRVWSLGSERQLDLLLSRQSADSRDGPNAFKGNDLQLGAEGLWRQGRHLLVAELGLTRRTIERANNNPAPGGPPQQTIAPRGDRRNLLSLLLQDQFDMGERLTLTAGLRYDSLHGIDERLTPRLALVWRLDPRHTLKAQYAEGFRTPTFIELFSAGPGQLSDLDFEVIRTSELGWQYRSEDLSLRATLFHSQVDDLILRLQAPLMGHANAGEVRSIGAELEAERRFGEHWRVLATISRAATRDTRGAAPGTRVDSFGEPGVLGNLALTWTPVAATTLGVHWNHVGDRSNPGAPDVPGYDQVDLAWTQRLAPQWQLRLSLRNVLDDPVVYISRLPPNRLQRNDYSERRWSLELGWKW